MNWQEQVDDVVAFYTTWASHCITALPAGDPAPRLAGRNVRVARDRIVTLCTRMDAKTASAHLTVDDLVELTCEATAAQPLVCSQLGTHDMAVLNAEASLILARTLARVARVSLPGADADEELVEALTVDFMDSLQRRDVVRAIYATQPRTPLSERERPDPQAGPIVSFGTPISAVTHDEQQQSVQIADELAVVVVQEFGWQADIPGHAIDPNVLGDGNRQPSREFTSRSSLAYGSVFIGVNSHLGRRGLGYAVRQAETCGAPVLLLPATLEPFGFARVFPDRFAHREEVVFEDIEHAQAALRTFLHAHTDRIAARHERVLTYRRRLETLSRQLVRKLATVDLRAVANQDLTASEAQFLASDPIHLGQAQPWELDDLARLVGADADTLKRLVYIGPGSSTVRRPRPAPGRSDSRLVTEMSAFAAARELREGTPQRWLQLLDEYFEQVLTQGTAAKRGRPDAQDWIDAYQRRFE